MQATSAPEIKRTFAIWQQWLNCFISICKALAAFSPVFVVFILTFTLSEVKAETGILRTDPASTKVDLATASWLLEDPEGKLTLADVQHPNNARRFERKLPNIGFTSSAYWLRFTIASDATQPITWWFSSSNRTLQEIALFSPDEKGVYQAQSASSNQPFADRPLRTAYFVFPLTLSPKKESVIYLRVRSTGAMAVIIAPQLWQPTAYKAVEKRERSQWLLYLGITSSLGIFNLLLWVALRDMTYLRYVIALSSGIWGICSVSGGFGSAYEYFWPNSPFFEQAAWILAAFVAAWATTYFLSNFINLDKNMPRVKTLLYLCVIIMGFLTIAILIGQILVGPAFAKVSQKLYIVSAVVFGVLYSGVAFSLCVLGWRGSRQAKILSVAWVPVILFATLWSVQISLGQTYNISLVAWSSAFELIIMSLALGDRFNEERKARALVQFNLAEVLRSSERELEEKVISRTLELQKEQNRTKDLLHNILPVDVAVELSETGSSRPARHESVTIMFTDLMGFTQTTTDMSADKMVAELNEIFAAFDDIADVCGVEKIKTIGNMYMAAAGLPKPCVDHAQRCVYAGLMMMDYLKQRNNQSDIKWPLRVGIHSGPVVSGVVGKRKFAFDIWGDTVNVASRIESAGEMGRVNISAYTCHLIQNDFECQYRGKLEAKGKGQIDMYFVKEALKSSSAPNHTASM